MPYRINDSIISNFLTNHTVPLQLSALPLDHPSQQCPVCHERYHTQNPTYVHPLLPPDVPEYPVQIFNRGMCRHIFGRHCIERHIRANRPWSHVCPMCREEWFPAPNAARTELVSGLNDAVNALSRIDTQDEEVRREIEAVERGLDIIMRNLLDSQRWI